MSTNSQDAMLTYIFSILRNRFDSFITKKKRNIVGHVARQPSDNRQSLLTRSCDIGTVFGVHDAS